VPALHYHDVSLNDANGKRRTALHWAVFRGDAIATQFLLQVARVDPVPSDFGLHTPVHFAARSPDRFLEAITSIPDVGNDSA